MELDKYRVNENELHNQVNFKRDEMSDLERVIFKL